MRLYRALRALLRHVLRAGWRLQVTGAEHVPAGALVIVANHDSLVDPVVLGCALPRPARFLAKQELFTGPLGVLLTALGAIPVARGRGDREAVSAGLRALARGDAVVVFPQGTVLGAADRPWLRGAARLALESGTPVLPVRLQGTAGALAPGRRLPRPARIRVTIGRPLAVPPAPVTVAAARALTDAIRRAVDRLGAA